MVAPAPRVPPVRAGGEIESVARTRLGSAALVGLEGMYRGADAGGEALRDSQCIVLDIEGRREREGETMVDWLLDLA